MVTWRGWGIVFLFVFVLPTMVLFGVLTLIFPGVSSIGGPPEARLIAMAIGVLPSYYLGCLALWQFGHILTFGWGKRPAHEGWWSAGWQRRIDQPHTFCGGSAYLWALLLALFPLVGLVVGPLTLLFE